MGMNEEPLDTSVDFITRHLRCRWMLGGGRSSAINDQRSAQNQAWMLKHANCRDFDTALGNHEGGLILGRSGFSEWQIQFVGRETDS